ncbi:MAG: SDR family oxidoreductase [Gemmataceae bacterium]|nr:SDR family oxidoreductase [Gemmataceae bacterium]
MIPIDLSGKVALVTGVGDSESFAWFISKALQAAGAKLYFASHPRMVGIVENILEREADAEARALPYGAGELKVEKVLACDVAYDTLEDAPEAIRNDRRWNKHGDFTIKGMMDKLTPLVPGVDILIHSVAFSREIKNRQLETSRAAYLEAIGISSYSLTALTRAVAPMMEARGGGSVVGLSYIGGVRVVPHYGGGMSTAKAALEIDARQLAGNLGSKNIRVNIISAGPYASRAASAIGDIKKMIDHAAEHSLMPRPIGADEVANATAFLCSPLASAITGHVLYVDCGYNAMGV